MKLLNLYQELRKAFQDRCDPEKWWPVYKGRTDPPEFERVITNILVQNSSWKPVQRAVDALDSFGLLTSNAIVGATVDCIATCVKPTGLQVQKATRLKALAAFLEERFGSERVFCTAVTRDELLDLKGIGEETADRIILYACHSLAWPVDTYCRRVLKHHGVIPHGSDKPTASERRREAEQIKELVADEVPHSIEHWQRLHALMQLEGEAMRGRKRDGR